MNWLYFVSKNADSLDEIDELLQKKKALCSTVFIEDLPQNFIGEDFVSALRNTDYIIFNLENGFENSINFIFALGFAEGKEIISFINSKVEFDSNIVPYSSISELKKILKIQHD